MNKDNYNDSQKIARSRKKPLEGDKVEAKLRDQIPDALLKVVRDKDIGTKVVEDWNRYNSLRSEQLERQRKMLLEIDEFIEPIYRAPLEWQSTLHMPMSYIVCKAFHARMMAAVFPQGEKVQVKARKEANMDRADMVKELMEYTVERWANEYQGVQEIVDAWLWDWTTIGRGILKQRWVKKFSRFVDVEEFYVEGPGQVVQDKFVPTIDTIEKAVKKDELVFEGPQWEVINNEDLLIVGGNGDADKADFVCQQIYMTVPELWSLVDQKIFDKETVTEMLSTSSGDSMSIEPVNQIKNQMAERSGEGGSVDDQNLVDKYQILEAYIKVDLDNSGIYSDLVVWVHKDSRKILRATYLYRIARTGQKPYQVINFQPRKNQQHPIGLIELTYPIAKELDAMSNMKRDFGLLSSIPIGFYKASSSLSKERIPLEPGMLIPLNDPTRDIIFPQIGARHAFAANEEASLFNVISRITGLSDLNFGSLSAQGATRTATGSRAILQESNANLDVFLRRANLGFKKALIYLFHLLRENMPDGLEFRITGRDGSNYFRMIQTKTEIAGMYDFEVSNTSADSNQQIIIEKAQAALQITQNPLLLQLGVVSPGNLFEAAKSYLQALGVKDWSKYISPPPQGTRVFTPEELANRILAGVDVVLGPDQDLEGFINFTNNLMNNDELLGQFNEQQTVMLARKMQEAQQLLAALQQQQAQQANVQQIQSNSQMTTGLMGGQGLNGLGE